MSDIATVHDQYYEMANAPVNRIIPKLAVPTIISMLVTSIYNMADTFFVSQLGTSASGAIGIVFSAMAIIQALSFMVGMGSGNYIARSIGAGVSKAGPVILDYIKKYYLKYTFRGCRGAKFVLATLGNDAGMYGSAKLVLEQ